ncbi:MAG: alpha/beta hydrolase [Nevskiaceae bacterium]
MTLTPVIVTVALAYAGLCAVMFLLQDRMLFLPSIPGREIAETPAALGLPFEEITLTAEDGVRLHGWWVPAPDARRTLVHFHGNAGNISHRLELLQIFHGLGLNVLMFDYRGYGRSEGAPTEAGMYLDAEAAWSHLLARGVRPADIVLHGQSMGGAVAAHLAAQREPAALVLESAFTSAPDVAADIYWWLPVRLLARLRLDTRAALAQVRSPVLVIHSRDDEIIPFAHGQALHAAAPGRKTLVEIRGDHNGAFWISREAYTRAWREFLATLPGT